MALTPGDARIWGLLGLPPPKGAPVGRATFPAWPKILGSGASPPFLTSLFVQYKRPDYLTTARAREWSHHGSPYYRMHLTNHQHQLLLQLAQTVGSDATVLSAAPSFWKYDDMWLNQGAGQIMERSMLIEAEKIGPGHHLWTWALGGRGVAHSEPREDRYRTIAQIRDELTTKARREVRKTPGDHLGAIASAMLEARVAEKPRERWHDELRTTEAWGDAASADPEAISELADAAIVAEGASKARVSWLILGLSERGPTAPA
jgi:hypothetical protein